MCFAPGLEEEENNNLYELMIVIIATSTCEDLKTHTFACRDREKRNRAKEFFIIFSLALFCVFRLVLIVVGRTMPIRTPIHYLSSITYLSNLRHSFRVFQREQERFLFTNCSEREERERERERVEIFI